MADFWKPYTAQIHRFRDRVAVHIGTGDTVYMTHADARKMARALNLFAKSVKTESFVDSTCGTFTMERNDA